MSILIGLAHEPVFNAAMTTQIVFQQPARWNVEEKPMVADIAYLQHSQQQINQLESTLSLIHI